MFAIDPALLQSVTLAIAVIGAVLGLLNAWRNWVNDRVRVRVSVSQGVDTLGARVLLIGVVNLSTFPVTIDVIGFNRVGATDHVQLTNPQFLRAHTLPERLESRAALTVVQRVGAMPSDIAGSLRQAYVKTACGHTFIGGRKCLDEYRRSFAAK